MQAGDCFKGHPSPSFSLLTHSLLRQSGARQRLVASARCGRPMIVFIPHVGSGSTPLKGLSFLASYKTTSLAHIGVQRG